MKIFVPLVVAMSLLPVPAALAGWDDDDGPAIHATCCEDPVRWAPRHDLRDAAFDITTRDRSATLVLTDKVVAVQLSDRTMREVNRRLRDEMEDAECEDGLLARTIKTVVISSVRGLLDHSMECRIRDLRDVEYRRGRLVFTTRDGDRIFEDIKVDDEDVMADFSERDARLFVRAFHEVKARRR